jgi:hypothetical protein
VTINDAPRLEGAKTVSGDVTLTGVTADGDLSAGSVSGNVRAKGLKARGLDLGSVSGDINVSDVTCERLGVKTVSGGVEYAGGIAKGGRYEINAHSGTVRLQLANPAGFELTQQFQRPTRLSCRRRSARIRRGETGQAHAASRPRPIVRHPGDLRRRASLVVRTSAATSSSQTQPSSWRATSLLIIGIINAEVLWDLPRPAMKRIVCMGSLIRAFAVTGMAQTDKGQGHTAPKQQPSTGPAVTVPTGEMALGSVHIPKSVKADGKPLAAGTYQVRLTQQNATPDAKGETASSERWVEFVKGGKVEGREVVTIIPGSEISQVQKAPAARELVKNRNAEGRRLRAPVDQQGRESLSRALRCLAASFVNGA